MELVGQVIFCDICAVSMLAVVGGDCNDANPQEVDTNGDVGEEDTVKMVMHLTWWVIHGGLVKMGRCLDYDNSMITMAELHNVHSFTQIKCLITNLPPKRANQFVFATKCVKPGLCAHSSMQRIIYFFQLQIFTPA